MEEEENLPLPLYLACMLVATRLEGLVLQAPQEVVVKAITERPELFHYRALRNGKLLMWDLRMETALREIDEYVPRLADAARAAGIDVLPPFHAFEQEDTIPHKLWEERKANIHEPIVDTTDPNSEPIYGGAEIDIPFLDTDAALDQLNEALEMSDGPEKEKAIERAKDLLNKIQEDSQ